MTRKTHRLPPGEIPEGRARAPSDQATQLHPRKRTLTPVLEPGVIGNADLEGIGPQTHPFNHDR